MASAFEIYLRTGRRIAATKLERKFNPWHDPDDGRFTFAGGGHFIAARFNGPRDWFNHFAQDANFNRSGFLALENEWAKAIKSGKRVFVDIVPHYHGTSMRPHRLTVTWYVDSQRRVENFPNEKGGSRDAKY